MARLSSLFRKKNKTTRHFREQFKRLPKSTRELSRQAAQDFFDHPEKHGLRIHHLHNNSVGRHRDGSISVSISNRYRAIYYINEDGLNIWYWIGSHSAYNTFTGSS